MATPECEVLLGGEFSDGSSPKVLGTILDPDNLPKVTLSGMVSSNSNLAAAVALYDSGKNFVTSVNTASDGSFTLSNVPMGEYYLLTSKGGHLSVVTQITAETNLSDISIQMFAGDVDGSGQVDAPDLTATLNDFNKMSNFSYEYSDLDGDGRINAADLSQIINNFNRKSMSF